MNNLEKTNELRKFYQKKRIMIPLLLLIAFIILCIIGIFSTAKYISTNNAIVEEYIVQVFPPIQGKIIKINVQNNTKVKKNDVLAIIENKDYLKTIKEFEQKYIQAQNELFYINEDIEKTNQIAKNIQHNMTQAKTDLENANNDLIRYKNAYKDGTVTRKDLKNATKNLRFAQNQQKDFQEQFAEINAEIKEINIDKNFKLEEVKKIEKEYTKTKRELSKITLVAPKDGTITNSILDIDKTIDTKEPVLKIVPDFCYIAAIFNEQFSNKFSIGQKATISIQSQGIKRYSGEIVDIIKQENNLIVKIKILDKLKNSTIKTGTRAYVKIKLN